MVNGLDSRISVEEVHGTESIETHCVECCRVYADCACGGLGEHPEDYQIHAQNFNFPVYADAVTITDDDNPF